MTNIDEVIERCSEVISKWQERTPTIEMAQDFAAVFGFELNWTLQPKEFDEALVSKSVAVPEQNEFAFELSPDDKFAIKGWRDNNGL